MLFSCDLAKPSNQRALRLTGKKLLFVYLHPVKFGSHRHYGGGYIMTLVCYATSHDQVIIVDLTFWPLKVGHHLSSFVTT